MLAFARAGYNVAFTYNSHPDAADAVRRQAEEINPGGLYLAIRADAGDPAQVRAAVARAEQELGSLQVLVCNAGIAQVKLFTDTTDEDWRRMMAVDLDGAFYACRAVLPGMIHRKYGRILLVSSMWGQTGGSCEVKPAIISVLMTPGAMTLTVMPLGPSSLARALPRPMSPALAAL